MRKILLLLFLFSVSFFSYSDSIDTGENCANIISCVEDYEDARYQDFYTNSNAEHKVTIDFERISKVVAFEWPGGGKQCVIDDKILAANANFSFCSNIKNAYKNFLKARKKLIRNAYQGNISIEKLDILLR